MEDANLLLATEIGLAAALALLFNVSRIAWENRHKVQIAEMAALVYARDTHNWFTRWRERRLVKRLPVARDAFILTLLEGVGARGTRLGSVLPQRF